MAKDQRAESRMGQRVHKGVSKNQNSGQAERAKKKSRKSSTFPQHLMMKRAVAAVCDRRQ
jgi:hypothetical protein